MGRPEVALSAITVVVGTTIYWAATYQGAGFRLSTVGDNFMIRTQFSLSVDELTVRRVLSNALGPATRQN